MHEDQTLEETSTLSPSHVQHSSHRYVHRTHTAEAGHKMLAAKPNLSRALGHVRPELAAARNRRPRATPYNTSSPILKVR